MKVRRSPLATAAVRDAEDGREFCASGERGPAQPHIVSGEEEARLSALGVISGIPDADGVIGDLGGGSLELVARRSGRLGGRARCARAAAALMTRARAIADMTVDEPRERALAARGAGRTSTPSAAPGAPRAAPHGAYRLSAARDPSLRDRGRGARAVAAWSPGRAPIAGADAGRLAQARRHAALRRPGARPAAAARQPRRWCSRPTACARASSTSKLEAQARARPAARLAGSRLPLAAIRPSTGRNLRLDDQLVAQGISSAERLRARRLLLADIGWRAHPDYRGGRSLMTITPRRPLSALYPSRVFIALAVFYRYEGPSSEDAPGELLKLPSATTGSSGRGCSPRRMRGARLMC